MGDPMTTRQPRAMDFRFTHYTYPNPLTGEVETLPGVGVTEQT
jgi:hypothetical protein